MRKVLLALDGEHFPQGAFELAAEMHRDEPILLAGVFLSPIDVSKIIAYTGVEAVPLMPSLVETDFSEKIQRNISRFEKKCLAEGLEYRIHNDSENLPLASLIKETRFADLLLIGRESFFSNVNKEQPNEYMQELLKKTDCPVLLVLDAMEESERVVLLYDGDASSVFAIKQFAYLFPGKCSLPTTLVQATVSPDNELEDQTLVTELAARHYSNLTLQEVGLHDRQEAAAFLSGQQKSWLVTGAYGRSMFSTLFRKSFADELIRRLPLPLFIAHK